MKIRLIFPALALVAVSCSSAAYMTAPDAEIPVLVGPVHRIGGKARADRPGGEQARPFKFESRESKSTLSGPLCLSISAGTEPKEGHQKMKKEIRGIRSGKIVVRKIIMGAYTYSLGGPVTGSASFAGIKGDFVQGEAR